MIITPVKLALVGTWTAELIFNFKHLPSYMYNVKQKGDMLKTATVLLINSLEQEYVYIVIL